MTTHEVFNQAAPLSGVNLWQANRPLQDALALLRRRPLGAPSSRSVHL